jgi:hypothetical protein
VFSLSAHAKDCINAVVRTALIIDDTVSSAVTSYQSLVEFLVKFDKQTDSFEGNLPFTILEFNKFEELEMC